MAKVKKIVIEMGKKEVVLTPAEARELRNALDEVLGEKVVTVPRPYPVPYPQPYPVYPRPRRYWEWTTNDLSPMNTPYAPNGTVTICATSNNTARLASNI